MGGLFREVLLGGLFREVLLGPGGLNREVGGVVSIVYVQLSMLSSCVFRGHRYMYRCVHPCLCMSELIHVHVYMCLELT